MMPLILEASRYAIAGASLALCGWSVVATIRPRRNHHAWWQPAPSGTGQAARHIGLPLAVGALVGMAIAAVVGICRSGLRAEDLPIVMAGLFGCTLIAIVGGIAIRAVREGDL